jgi:hypothetical protein
MLRRYHIQLSVPYLSPNSVVRLLDPMAFSRNLMSRLSPVLVLLRSIAQNYGTVGVGLR